jgi:hypothetical protein
VSVGTSAVSLTGEERMLTSLLIPLLLIAGLRLLVGLLLITLLLIALPLVRWLLLVVVRHSSTVVRR